MPKKILCLLPLLPIFFIIQSCSKPSLLDENEKKWLAQNDSITVAIYPYYPPYQFINEQNQIDGIFIEYLELVEQKINYKFKRKRYDDWPKLLEGVKNNDASLILEIQQSDEKEYYLKFYEPLFESQNVIVTRDNVDFGNDVESLAGKSIVLPQGYAITENLRKKYPNFNIITLYDELTCLSKVNAGDYDATISPKAVANYYIRSKKMDNLKIKSGTDLYYEPGFAINQTNTVLDGIISKTISKITKEEKQAIVNNWFYTNVIPFYRTSKFWTIIALVALLSLLFGMSFNSYLKYKIKQRTDELMIAKDIAEESNRLKTNFIYNIPQEIRTPMNGIIGLSEFLNNEDLSLEDRKKYTQMIIGNSKELLSIIDNILEISQLQSNRFTLRLIEVNLQNVFQNLISNYKIKAEEKNIEFLIENKLKDQENIVLMDRPKLNKILNVLIDNAIRYTEDGSIKLFCDVEEEFLTISVVDTGIGISETTKNKIIESLTIPSSTDKTIGDYSGMGLGLTIAKKNTDFIGGQLQLISEKNKGTSFTLKVPYNPLKKISAKTTQTSKPIAKPEKNIILIAEDGETNFLFLKTILTKMNDYDFTIYRAKNGKEAVSICQENKNIDLVLMDIKMPVMDGYDATAYIKKMRPNLPVIAQTAYSIEEDIQKALDAGCDDFVSKPVDRKILKPILNKYFSVLNKRNKAP
ncbi:transporter substrate-binding domain-containing protein [uncultured Aquimarina sp.]|uniref:hybrid sensor histidine kinase/response regulator n=1 Tax=uncultured Aquimarina sp. TaxID=575652 RepID=UPI00260BF673|nr:transporter substrate-binding domain-containing protein [uncultured Aquimarina sp.]